MRRGHATGVLLAALLSALLFAASAQGGERASSVSVSVDRNRISTKLGEKFVFRSTITNRGSTPASRLIAHLNVLSLRDGVYVDPEDWSSRRTRYLGTIPAGRSISVRWSLQAVTAGDLAVYVSVLSETAAGRRPVNGPAIQLAVAQRRTLNSGGVLPLAVGMPALLGLASLALRFRRRG
ncbi:MAG TPA: hypothetical protein VGU26_04835 [Gaiellaceae bacterium]|nr:hypothetical protein [Gaiellaceae bacterium]